MSTAGRHGDDAAGGGRLSATTAVRGHRGRAAFVIRRAGAPIVLAVVVIVTAGPALGSTGPVEQRDPSAARSSSRRVLIIATPRLRWEDVASVRPPHLLALADRSAVASMSVRVVNPATSPADGYATIGAGNRTNLGARFPADEAFGEGERFGGLHVSALFRSLTGRAPTQPVVVPQIGAIERTLRSNPYGARTGLLADELAARGHRAAVVADSDMVLFDASLERHRAAALAMIGDRGEVSGTVGGLSVVDPGAAGGLRLDRDRVIAAVEREWARSDVVLVELSDLERADGQRSQQTAGAGGASWRDAVRRSDELVGGLLATVDPARDLVVVASPTSPRTRDQLGVAMVSGPPVRQGWATASPRRPGYVTLVDVAPTVLSFLRTPIPSAMAGRTIRSVAGRPAGPELVGALVDHNAGARFQAVTVGPVSTLVVVLAALVAILGLAGRWLTVRWVESVVQVLAASGLWLPSVVFSSGMLPVAGLSPGVYVLSVTAAAAALGCVSLPLQRRRPITAALVITGVFAVLSVVDVATGARLQINTPLGYSPVVAGRFAGFGNLAFGLTAMALIVAATTMFARMNDPSHPAARGLPSVALIGAGAVLAVGGFAIAAPWWGSKFGGTIAAIPGFAVTLLVLSGRRINWRMVIGLTIATILGIGLVGFIDLLRPADQQTHIGQFLRTLGNGEAARVIHRKLDANLRILTSSIWAALVPVGVAFLVLVNRQPAGQPRPTAVAVPGVRACVAGACVIGVIGALLTDSGVAVPAAMFAILIPYLALLSVRHPRRSATGGT